MAQHRPNRPRTTSMISGLSLALLLISPSLMDTKSDSGGMILSAEAFLPPVAPHRALVRAKPSFGRLFMSTPTKEDKDRVISIAKKEGDSKKEDTRPDLEHAGPAYPTSVNGENNKKANGVHQQQQQDPPATATKKPEKKKLYDGLDGQAKKEEPGDRDLIMSAIKQYEFDIWKTNPTIPFETLIQRTLDTAEDAYLHLRRVPYDKGWFLAPEKEDRKTIVVLGSGWAAHALLKVADTYKLRIIVVSPSNHFVFTPMLASASVGTVEYRSMTEAVRAANPMIHNYLEGQATDIDVEQKTLKVKMNSLLEGIKESGSPELEIKYDKLVVGEYRKNHR